MQGDATFCISFARISPTVAVQVLAYSTNMLDWRIASTVLLSDEGMPWADSVRFTGFHYAGAHKACQACTALSRLDMSHHQNHNITTCFYLADWIFNGNDILMVIRTAYRGAASYHNSNRHAQQHAQTCRYRFEILRLIH